MNALAISILRWLLALPIHSDDATELPDDRRARMTIIAEQVSEESQGNRELAAFILVDFKRESDFSRRVQVCDCPPLKCDWDRKAKVFLAHGPAQVHKAPSWTVAKWDAFCGTSPESIRLSARFVAGAYRLAKARKRPLACAFSELGGTGLVGCLSPWAIGRAESVKRLTGKL
jgi:hypothetical protein